MHCTVPLLGEPLPVENGLFALGRLELWPWGPAGAVGLPAVDANEGLAPPQAGGWVHVADHPKALHHMVPTRVSDYQIKILMFLTKSFDRPVAELALVVPRLGAPGCKQAGSFLRRAGAVIR